MAEEGTDYWGKILALQQQTYFQEHQDPARRSKHWSIIDRKDRIALTYPDEAPDTNHVLAIIADDCKREKKVMNSQKYRLGYVKSDLFDENYLFPAALRATARTKAADDVHASARR